MRLIKLIAPMVVLVAGFAICTSSVYGNQTYAKKEKKSCTFCHAKVLSDKTAMTQNLNTKGNCYKDNDHSLANCTAKK